MTDGPRLRFAPSPTGPLHLGGARTALYNWAAARSLGGKFLLRIEDTDRARSTEESLQIILDGLRWLGLDWDEGPDAGGEFGPYLQTERLDVYLRYIDLCVEKGWAYECYATPEEVEEGRKALAERGEKPMYDRRHRDLSEEERAAFREQGRRPSLRFRMPLDEVVIFPDLVRGEVEINLKELDDWVMVRPDGMPTYNFVCAVDDLEMAITHVVRGEEHFLNGVKQMLLYRVFEKEPPAFAHIPLILGKNGKKLSKREASVNILDYRDRGYPPDAVFNYITLLGWSFSGDRDIFSRQEMVDRFTISGVGKSGARFDEEKLLAICGEYIRAMPVEELVAAVRPFLIEAGAIPAEAFETHADLIANVTACYQERIELYGELADKLAWVFTNVAPDEAAQKNLAKHEDARAWLSAYADLLEGSDLVASYPADRGDVDARLCLPTKKEGSAEDIGGLSPQALEQQARDFAEELGVKFGHFVHPVRAALTGTNKGPGLFDCLFLLGKQGCVERLRSI